MFATWTLTLTSRRILPALTLLIFAGIAAGCAAGSDPALLAPPAAFSASPGNRAVTLTWTEEPEVSYTLFWATHPGVDEGAQVINRVRSPYVQRQRENGVRVYYRLQAWDSQVASALSEELSAVPSLKATAPGAPASVTAMAGDGQVSLSWGAMSGASGYTLYRDTNSGVSPENGTAIQSSSSAHDDTGVSNGVTYYYVVTATVDGTEGPPSAEVSATPKGGSVSLPAPLGLNAVAGDTQVTISWAAVAGATSYTLYWQQSSGVSKASATSVPGTSAPHTHKGLTNGTTYYYAVSASNAAGESPLSTESSATPQPGASPVHGSVSGTLTGGAYGVVMLENTATNQGIVQIRVYTTDPLGSPAGQPINGLSVSAGGAITGALTAQASAGTYQNTTAAPLTAGSYVFTVSGAVSGTVTAMVKDLPICTITSPNPSSVHLAGQDLKLTWNSTNSDKASILLQDSKGTVSYPPLKPDPGGAIVPGKDIPYKGALQIMVSAVWSAKGTGAALAVLDDDAVQILLQ